MNIYIVIPAHNEQDTIGLTIASLANQSFLPKKVVVVNDNSTDNTQNILEDLSTKYSWLSFVDSKSSEAHLPGTKIINAFYKGFDTLDEAYDIICKYDADLIFPENYLETLVSHFKSNDALGMAAGFCYIKKDNRWVIEGLTEKDHIRGALKAYRKACFLDIGKLKRSMGWDTIDELLALYFDWELKTDASLHVKHLKPTGANYAKGSKYLQGEALYKLRFGIVLAFLSALKLAYKKKSLKLFINYCLGYLKAARASTDYLITSEQGKFIRQRRWKKIFQKVF